VDGLLVEESERHLGIRGEISSENLGEKRDPTTSARDSVWGAGTS